MSSSEKAILTKGYSVNEKYSVILFIKKGHHAETYRVKGKDGKLYFLKLFDFSKLHRTAFDDENNLIEIEILRKVKHPNIISYRDDGELIVGGKKYVYLVLEFVAGETLADRITKEPISTVYDAKMYISGILNGLNYLHNLPDPIIHNEITLLNVMLDLSGNTPIPKIIDFGYARSFHQSTKAFNKEGLNLNYTASESFKNLYSPQSDLFSVGAVLYHLLFGTAPWFKDISKYMADRVKMEEVILEERKKLLKFPDVENKILDYDDSIMRIIKKALHSDTDIRFKTAGEFLQALNGEMEVEDVDKVRIQKSEEDLPNKSKLSTKPKGSGFDSVAGMDGLKRMLTIDVIDALRDPEKYKKYDISFPNGILFYGPPRCGKTFFAKKFAEEVGYNYMYIKPSTLKSRYVNATQENIAKMFEEAEKNAPTIIFIDELNELVPNRDSDVHEMSKSAVNEMLAQMDRTGDKGIFIIGATNYPEMIDPAMLGAGRLEKKFYIGPPDFELRKSLFQMYLNKKPLDFGIDYDVLAKLTENYVTGDIELLVNEAAKKAMLSNGRVSMQMLQQTIKIQKPTVSVQELKKYEAARKKIENERDDDNQNERPRIGFKI